MKYMKKRRGKQPVKPNVEEALKPRLLDLKGAHNSSMNIPIVYRRTFGWAENSVLFTPVNRRAFVIHRSGLDNEELEVEGYVQKRIDIEEIPWYHRNRAHSKRNEKYYYEQLKEYLISLSLSDRYVQIDINKPKDSRLDMCLKCDLEYLAGQLGYQYTATAKTYRCTFVFPHFSNRQTVTRCTHTLMESLDQLKGLKEKFESLEVKQCFDELRDAAYGVNWTEANMDRYYTEALNVAWDLPQMEQIGHFLIIQYCERAYDEIHYVISHSQNIGKILEDKDDDITSFLWKIFLDIWNTSVQASFEALERVMTVLTQPDSVLPCLEILRQHRQQKELHTSPPQNYVSNLIRRVETMAIKSTKDKGYRVLADKHSLEIIHHLFSINQSCERIMEISSNMATTSMYLQKSSPLDKSVEQTERSNVTT